MASSSWDEGMRRTKFVPPVIPSALEPHDVRLDVGRVAYSYYCYIACNLWKMTGLWLGLKCLYNERLGALSIYYRRSRELYHMMLKGMRIGMIMVDRLFGIVVSMSDYHPRGPGLDSRLYPINCYGSIGSGTWATQPCEDNWVATWYEK